jgi:MFS family permease
MYLMAPFSGAFGGLIAYGLQKSIDGAQGYHAWQWLFILEGALTILWGLIVVTYLPALPDTVADEGSFIFRHESERRIIAARLRAGKSTSLRLK